MSEVETSSPGLSRPDFRVNRLGKLAGVASIYIGIATMFVCATFFLWFISLLIA
jgi:hypothetical protein